MRLNGEGCVNCNAFCENCVELTPVLDTNGGPLDLICPCIMYQCPCLKSSSVNDLNNILFEVEEKKHGIEKKITMTTSHNAVLVDAMLGSFIENRELTVMQSRSIYLTCANEEKLKQQLHQHCILDTVDGIWPSMAQTCPGTIDGTPKTTAIPFIICF